MKLLHLSLPLIALTISAAWLISQHSSISSLEQENKMLLEKIAASRTASEAGNDQIQGPMERNAPRDWKKFAAGMGDLSSANVFSDVRSTFRLQLLISEMSEAELVAAIDEITALDLPETARAQLLDELIDALAEKNPALAADLYMKYDDGENVGNTWQIQGIFEKWLERDSTAATAWYERQLAAGTFDSKSLDGESDIRLALSGKIIMPMLSSDLAAAIRLVNEIPADQRRSMFLNSFRRYTVEEKNQKAFADLIRATMPKKDHKEFLVEHSRREDLTEVSDYISRIDATPEERSAIVNQAALSFYTWLPSEHEISRADIDNFRTWAGSTDPAYADQTTGIALASAVGGHMSYDELADIASSYHAAGAGDDILIPLIEESKASLSKDKARQLAMRITDAGRREEILKNLK